MSSAAIELLTQIILDHGVTREDSVKRTRAVYMPDGIAWIERYHDQTVQAGAVLNYPARKVQTVINATF